MFAVVIYSFISGLQRSPPIKKQNKKTRLFRVISIPSKVFLFLSSRPRDFDRMLGIGLQLSMYTTKPPIDMWRFNVPQLKEFLTFSVEDIYQLNYFICIKDGFLRVLRFPPPIKLTTTI